jgi:glutathione S-transferase
MASMITLWGRRSSSNVQKVLWTLGELGLDYERKIVGGSFGGTQTPEYLAMSPNAYIPALQDGDVAMCESNAIVRYLAARYGADDFAPADWKQRAMAETWMEWQQLNPWPLMSTIFMQSVREPLNERDPEIVAAARAALPKHLAVADRHLASNRFFAGDTLTYGDIVMGTIMRRNQLTGVSLAATPHVERWFNDLQSREPYRQWVMVPDFGRTPESWTAHEKDLA